MASELKNLFTEFEPMSTAAWEAQVAKDSKGAVTADGLRWSPFANYPTFSLPATVLADAPNPALTPAIHAALSLKKAGWHYREMLCVDAAQELEVAEQALHCTQWGADSISIWGLAAPDYHKLLTYLGQRGVKGVRLYLEAPYDVVARAAHHPYFSSEGGAVIWVPSMTPSHVGEEGYLKSLGQLMSDLPYVEVLADVSGYAEAGACLITQHAIALSLLTEWIHRLSDNGIPPRVLNDRLEVHIAVGNPYLLELAGLRALRYLVHTVWQYFGVSQPVSRIWARGNQAYATAHDPDNNLLRNTTAALAIAAGSADVMSLPQHNAGVLNRSAQEVEASMRWARNVQHLLKEEAFAAVVHDPAAGSRYLELATSELADVIFAQFQQWEAAGGYLRCYKHQLLQQATLADAKATAEAIAEGKHIVIGANKFAPTSPKEVAVFGQPIPGLPVANFGALRS